ncbi:MAG: hypothetical protein ACK522_13705 [Synechococcaceae cyanobacterium]
MARAVARPYGAGMHAIAHPGGPAARRPLRRLVGFLLGGAAAWLATVSLPPVSSAVLVSLLLAVGASQVGAPQAAPFGLWLLSGAAAGGLFGTATSLAGKAQQLPLAAHASDRLTTVALLAVSGVVVGHCLGRDADHPNRRHPRELLRSASALTTGLFAFMVTLTFLHQGLEPARAFSSRLSTTLPIAVTAAAGPGWLTQQLRLLRRPPLPPPGAQR